MLTLRLCALVLFSLSHTLSLRTRLYSTKSFKHLGTLKYHKDGCQALSFATTLSESPGLEQEEEFDDDDERLKRCRWLVSGAKDKRIAIWELISFEKS